MRVWLLLLLLLVPSAGEARRSPSVGGEVRLALPEELSRVTRAAAQGRPLLEPADPQRPAWLDQARPRLAGTHLVSRWVQELVPDASGQRWRVVGAKEVVDTLRRCFDTSTWPAAVLQAAGLTVDVAPASEGALLRFDGPVPALPNLLTGCAHAGARSFQATEEALTRGGVGIHRIVLGAPDGPADVRVDAPRGTGDSQVVSGVDGVVLLVQGDASRASDPLGIGQGPEGFAQFTERLMPGLLAEVLADGRAEAAGGLLPAALVPARPPRRGGGAPAAATGSGSLRLAPADGRLLGGLADRLVALAQARQVGRSTEAPDSRLVRWGPPSEDPALSLLALAATLPELPTDDLDLASLLHADPARRLAAALDLERRWIDERRVLPLLTAKRWVAVHPDLRGVQLRSDGAVLLHDAYWRVP